MTEQVVLELRGPQGSGKSLLLSVVIERWLKKHKVQFTRIGTHHALRIDPESLLEAFDEMGLDRAD